MDYCQGSGHHSFLFTGASFSVIREADENEIARRATCGRRGEVLPF